MAALPYMQLYVADYLADTAHLTAAQHGAYLLLIFNYWQRGKPLNNSNERLTNVARMTSEEWVEAKPILSEFFEIVGDEWFHARIDRDLESVNSKSGKASQAGKASAARRAEKKATNVERTLNHTDTDTDTDTEEKNTPTSLREVPPTDSAKQKSVTLSQWIQSLSGTGEKLISGYVPLWDYCEKVGIPEDWVEIAWIQFRERYTTDEKAKRKRYVNWRRTFQNAVEGNWFKLWYFSERDNQFRLSTVGYAADLATKEAA